MMIIHYEASQLTSINLEKSIQVDILKLIAIGSPLSMSLTLANWLVIVIETSAPIIKISREFSTWPYWFNSFDDNVMYV